MLAVPITCWSNYTAKHMQRLWLVYEALAQQQGLSSAQGSGLAMRQRPSKGQ